MTKLSVSSLLLFALAAFPAGRAPAAEPAAATNATAPAKPASAAELFPDTAVAKGKGFEVKRSELDETVTSIKAGLAARGQVVSPDDLRMLERQRLDELIQIKILLLKATDAEKAKGQETCSNRFETMKIRAGNEETLNRQLKSLGMTQEGVRRAMLDAAIAEAVVERELNISVSEADVKKYYEDNPARFEQPEMVRASHILLSTKDSATRAELTDAQKSAKHKQMEDILKRARAGEDFAQLAKEYSEDPGSKDKGGEYTFPRGQMVKEFETAAFALNTNQISDIITTPFGYHIIKLLEKLPPRKIELAKVNQNIIDELKRERVQKQLPAYIEKTEKEAGVEILDEKLRSVKRNPEPPPAADPALKPEPKKP
jgi:peptidyl-prolyl cis-trans isomerase C